MSRFANFFLHKDETKAIEFYVKDAMPASYAIAYPGDAPTNGQALAYNQSTDSFEWVTFGTGSATGTVTSVALALPNIFTVSGSPITESGTITATLTTQTASKFFASPVAATGTPIFRILDIADIPNIPTTKLTGVLNVAQAPSGTNNSFFQVDVDSSGGRLAWDTGSSEFQLRNSDGTSYSNLRLNNLFIEGDTTIISSETLEVADNRILLNRNVTGTPTEDAGIEIERGTATNSFLQWNETTDKFECGDTGNILQIARSNNGTFTSANLTANVLTINHNLRTPNAEITIRNPSGLKIEFDTTTVSNNSTSVDMSRLIPSGTWTWHAKG